MLNLISLCVHAGAPQAGGAWLVLRNLLLEEFLLSLLSTVLVSTSSHGIN